MQIYLHAITITPPGPDGTLKSRKPDDPAIGMQFHSSTHIDQLQCDQLVALVRSYGGDLTLDVVEGENVLVTSKPEEVASEIATRIEGALRNHLGLVEGAKPNYDDARMNELERDVRANRRAVQQLDSKLDMIAQMLAQAVGAPQIAMANAPTEARVVGIATEPIQAGGLVTAQVGGDMPRAIGRVPLVTTPVPPVAFTPPAVQAFAQSATYAPTDIDPQQMQKMAQAQAKGFPLNTAPVPVVGDPTVAANPNARGHGKTPEMSSGVMSLAGPSPTSQVISFGGRFSDKGEPIFERHELPKVGDTLRPLSEQSDIKVP